MSYVTHLNQFPVKGMRGVAQNTLEVRTAVGIVGDRQFALCKKTDQAAAWAPKAAFRVGMNTPLIPTLTPHLTQDVIDPGQVLQIAEQLGVLELKVINTHREFNMTDSQSPSVSLLSLATARALPRMGTHTTHTDITPCSIDPRRFRMNVWIDGLEPFEELNWVGREITIGACQFSVKKPCERCKAINASPETGTYDIPLLQELGIFMEKRGYEKSPKAVMGLILTPLSGGVITTRDTIEVH